MKLSDIFAPRRPVFSFEFFPPKTAEGDESLLREARRLAELGPSFFSMTYGAGGGTRDKTLDLAERLRRETGVETVCHVTCVGQSREEVRGVLRRMRELGMSNVMALRGDPPRGVEKWEPHPDGFRYAAELVREARSMGGFSVAVAGFPEMHPESTNRDDDLKYLKAKVDEGADVVVTQLFFDNDDYFRFVRDARALGVEVPIVPGILPVLAAKQVRSFAAMCKAKIPPALEARLAEVADDDEAARALGVRYAADQIRGLLEGGAPGIHLYSLNRSRSAAEIFDLAGLRSAG